jgi:hypothetical protein
MFKIVWCDPTKYYTLTKFSAHFYFTLSLFQIHTYIYTYIYIFVEGIFPESQKRGRNNVIFLGVLFGTMPGSNSKSVKINRSLLAIQTLFRLLAAQ